MSDNAIVVDDVSKYFRYSSSRSETIKEIFTLFGRKKNKNIGAQVALKNINFEIKKGEFIGIVGRNGSGKSTLLKILAGIYQPSKGSVTVSGKLVPFIELGVGFNPELTGKENVYLNGALLGFSNKEVNSFYKQVVEFAELGNYMDKKLKNYSTGMQVRLAFSMAVRSKADILVIDEVLAVGDADFQRKCFQYFRGLKGSETTVVFVSHDMEAIREYCDRSIVINDSEIIFNGSPEEAAEKYIQLFNSSFWRSEKVSSGQRWGDGSAKFDNVEVSKNLSSMVNINSSISFKEDMDSPIVGFIIKNSSGEVICGTNSKILRKKMGSFKAGDKIKIEWVLPNIFGSDDFAVDVAITHQDTVTQADWWHNATRFTNNNSQSTPHKVSPPTKLSIKR